MFQLCGEFCSVGRMCIASLGDAHKTGHVGYARWGVGWLRIWEGIIREVRYMRYATRCRFRSDRIELML
jgi:hypothetical protein